MANPISAVECAIRRSPCNVCSTDTWSVTRTSRDTCARSAGRVSTTPSIWRGTPGRTQVRPFGPMEVEETWRWSGFRCTSVQMQSLREVFHAEVFLRVALSQSARRAAPVRLQRAQNKGLCVRRVRTHDQWTRSALPAPKRETPVQPCFAQILRQEAFQIHKLKFR